MTICSIRQPTPLAPTQAKLVTAPPQSVSLFLPRKENRGDCQGLPTLVQGKGPGFQRHPPLHKETSSFKKRLCAETAISNASTAGPESRGSGHQLAGRARGLRVPGPMHRHRRQELANRAEKRGASAKRERERQRFLT